MDQGQAGMPGSKSGRYTLDCTDAGQGCSLRMSGSYDEVLDAGVLHGMKAHGMRGEETKLREDIMGMMKEESGAGMAGQEGRDAQSRPTEGSYGRQNKKRRGAAEKGSFEVQGSEGGGGTQSPGAGSEEVTGGRRAESDVGDEDELRTPPPHRVGGFEGRGEQSGRSPGLPS